MSEKTQPADELPALPKRSDTVARSTGLSWRWIDVYSADQMHAYARTAIAADRIARTEPGS